MVKSRKWLSVYAVALFFTLLSGDTERYALTWYGWGVIIAIIFAISVVLIVRARSRWQVMSLPLPLLGFVALTILSIAWSDYREWTVAGVIGTVAAVVGAFALALTFTLRELVRLFGNALRIILLASILFELVVGLIVRQPFIPWWAHYSVIHPADYWSRDVLLKGGRIQGIMGNSDLLGFIALLGVIVFALELAARSINRVIAMLFLIFALVDIALTRSATVFVAGGVVLVAALVLLLIRSTTTRRARRAAWIGSLVVVLAGVALVLVEHGPVLKLLGKTSTLTGRTKIWGAVIQLAEQRPVAGWGWISYWAPNVAPYDKKIFNIGGIQYLQAHEAWLDVWVQLGIIGLVVFGALVISTLVRAWMLAIDRPQLGAGIPGRYDPLTLVPVLVLVALLAQSFAESRLLIEYGMLLLSLIAIKTKRPHEPFDGDPTLRRPVDAGRTVPGRTVPASGEAGH